MTLALIHLDQDAADVRPQWPLAPLVWDYDPVATGPDGAYHQPNPDQPGRAVCGADTTAPGWHTVAAWRAADQCRGRYCPTCYPPIDDAWAA